LSEKEAFHPRRHGRSLFGPIILIALGLYFLLANLGIVSGLNWVGVLQLWPLILIFIGVNVIARQAPGALGTLLSALVGITAVALFGYVLLAGEDNPLLNRLGISSFVELIREDIHFAAADDIEQAHINIDLDAVDGQIYALTGSQNLIEGTVSYTGDLIFETETANSQATITLDAQDNRFPFWGIGGPGYGEGDDWQIGLSPEVLTDLNVDAGSGALRLDLAGLRLNDLTVDTGSGSSKLFLPGGEYAVEMDSGSGSTEITLAGDSRTHINFDAGSGSLTVYLPPTTAARIEFNGGSGRLHVAETFQQVSGDEHDGVWETAGFATADSFADLTIDVGSGNVWVRPPAGR
jgi:hypothetical protein